MRIQFLWAATTAAVLVVQSPSRADTYVYVGSYAVEDGPDWSTNPQVYSAREAAALIFGGTYTDYAISTNFDTTNADSINFQAYVDGWGDAEYLTHTVSQDFKLDTPPGGYNNPGGTGSAYSAYVHDHASVNAVNFVWRDVTLTGGAAAPLPQPVWAVPVLLGAAGLLRLRRRKFESD